MYICTFYYSLDIDKQENEVYYFFFFGERWGALMFVLAFFTLRLGEKKNEKS